MINIAKKRKGFLLVEAIVGVSILSFCLLGIISVGQGFLRLSFQSFQGAQVNFLLEEGTEVARAFRDNSWSNISNLTVGTKYYINYSGGKWATSTTPNLIDDVFIRYFTVSNVNRDSTTANIVVSGGVLDSGTRKVTINVVWETSMGMATRTAMVYLTNI